MNKVVFILFSMLLTPSYSFEDVPVFPQDLGVNIEYIENQQPSINVDKMKRAEKVKDAQNNLNSNNQPKLEFNSRQMTYQRALDYVTKQSNSTVMPRF